MSLKINSAQLVYNQGNVYYFTKEVYNSNDIFYIFTNFSSLINIDKIIIYNTLTRDISNILASDVVNNIYLYRQWKDNSFAIFKRDRAQEAIDKAEAGILNPGEAMITTLKRVGGDSILNPQRLLITDGIVDANFLSPTFSI